ncbi:MAG: patatin-like protein [Sphingomonadales bacterium]
MKEKELRLALVCGGGISLAVYIHGVTREILKLVRASKVYHSVPDLEQRRQLSFRDVEPSDDRECDSDEVYFDILKSIGEELDLRVIVDVIGGASAGGINSIFLARALAHDLPADHLRELWLKQADVRELAAEGADRVTWYKWLLKPVLRMLPRGSLRGIGGNVDASGKLSSLLPLRGMKPPFDGEKLLGALYDAIDSMGPVKAGGASLLPAGHQLELFVTVTDFFGYAQHIPLYDPPNIEEREHRHNLRFDYMRWPGGEEITRFSDQHVPALAFAARATSSYPGAFAPAQISEIDRLLARRKRKWDLRDTFLARNFKLYLDAGMDPTKTSFMDGSVLNNKPFSEAIEAIKGRPAFRQVDRRLVYVDPHPIKPPPPPTGRVPGFLSVLKAALSDIPRNEPVHDDLAWIDGFNLRVRRAKTIIDAARPEIEKLVASVARSRLDAARIAAPRITAWRQKANERAEKEVGFAYQGYARLKLTAVLEYVGALICMICGHRKGSAEAEWVAEVLLAWADRRDLRPSDTRIPLLKFAAGNKPRWAEFLESFDIDYRRRQVRFTIQSLNHLYERLDEPPFEDLTAARLDKLKARFYEMLGRMRDLDNGDFVGEETAAGLRALFSAPPQADDTKSSAPSAHGFAGDRSHDIDRILERLTGELDLGGLSRATDAVFAEIGGEPGLAATRRELLVDYLGFAFWDIVTFSMTNWRDLGEFDEIRVTRISPDDARAIRDGGTKATLKGIALANFGAFFSRRDRENDYLWGRLHAADRLIDILASAVQIENAQHTMSPLAMKKRAFEKILDGEEKKLHHSRRLIDKLRAEIRRIRTEEDEEQIRAREAL